MRRFIFVTVSYCGDANEGNWIFVICTKKTAPVLKHFICKKPPKWQYLSHIVHFCLSFLVWVWISDNRAHQCNTVQKPTLSELLCSSWFPHRQQIFSNLSMLSVALAHNDNVTFTRNKLRMMFTVMDHLSQAGSRSLKVAKFWKTVNSKAKHTWFAVNELNVQKHQYDP